MRFKLLIILCFLLSSCGIKRYRELTVDTLKVNRIIIDCSKEKED